MAGILDMFDSPETLRNLFGLGGGASPEQMSPLPPNGGIGSDGGRVPGQPQMMAMPPQRPPMPMPMPPPRPPMNPSISPLVRPDQSGAQSFDEAGMQPQPGGPAPTPPLPPAARAGMGPGGQGVPLPPPAPNANFNERFAAAEPGLPEWRPSGDEAGMIAGDPSRTANARGPAAPAPPPGGRVAPGGPQPPDPGLAGAFGLGPDQLQKAPSRADTMRAALSGVGKGLSAVGRMPAGSTAGASFAAGAGGSLEGLTDAQEKQKNTLFDQTSTAFKAMLAERSADNAEGYRAAQMQYLKARAKSIDAMTRAGKISGAYQNSPEYKVLRVEQMAQKFYSDEDKALREFHKGDVKSYEAAKEKLRASTDAYKADLYKKSGIDPAGAEKVKTMGTSKDNPFDARRMSPIEFDARVPEGGFFLNKDGKLYQRKSKPAHDPRSEAPAKPSAVASKADDDQAMDAVAKGSDDDLTDAA